MIRSRENPKPAAIETRLLEQAKALLKGRAWEDAYPKGPRNIAPGPF
jgi:hypothetical protein